MAFFDDPIQIIVRISVTVSVTIILPVILAWYLYRHGKRVGRLEAQALPSSNRTEHILVTRQLATRSVGHKLTEP